MGNRALQSLACGMVGTFVRRNNDVDGYWGMGQLYREAVAFSVSAINIDLFDPAAAGPGPVARAVQLRQAIHLKEMAAQSGVSLRDVRALVSVRFAVSEACVPDWSSYGDPFVCTVTLIGADGRSHVATLTGRCAPHDPAHEQRSLRADSAVL